MQNQTLATVNEGSEPLAAASWDLPPAGRAFIQELVRFQLLSPTLAGQFLGQNADHLCRYTNAEAVAADLIEDRLLTEYQAGRILAGTAQGLVLGNHKVVGRLGAGSMGIVFLAEHLFLKRRAAIKVLPVEEACPALTVERFYSEMRVLAELNHPHIVMAYDAGKLPPPCPGAPALLYLAMELVTGGDLEQRVVEHGPVPMAQACDWVCQAASGLQAAHDNRLIHRDVKPSNLLLTRDGRVKVVDFGLVRQFNSRLTDPHALLGTIDFMAPEQSHDASAVGSHADIFGLGATLFWLLTGEAPYPRAKTVAEAVRTLQQTRPRRLSTFRPDVPSELDALVDRMLSHDLTRRPALPLTVMKALQPFR